MDERMRMIEGLSEEQQSRVLKMLHRRLAREFAAADDRMDGIGAVNRAETFRSRDGLGQAVMRLDQGAYLALCARGFDPRDKGDLKYIRHHIPEARVTCLGKTMVGYVGQASCLPSRSVRYTRNYGVIDGNKH
jgi:hypothetical protein